MAFTVKEVTLSQRNGESFRGKDGRGGKRVFQVKYDPTTPPASMVAVETANDGTTAVPTVRTATTAGSAFPGDASRYASKVTVKSLAGDGLTFEVTVDYEDTLEDFEPLPENPLDEPDQIEWGGSESREAYFRDKSETPKPVVNGAGQPFDQFLERDTDSILVTVRRNVAGVNAALAVGYRNCVNAAAFTLDGASIGVGEAKIGIITWGPKQKRNGISYRVVTIPIALREIWDDKVENRGYQELVSGKLQDIVKGTPPTKVDRPWPLNANGTRKANATDPPDELTFVPYTKVSFAPLSFT